MNELAIPPIALEHKDSFEILRVWAADNEQHVTIHPELSGNACDFGYMLANLADHGARLYSQRFGKSRKETLKEILDGFTNEFKNQTGNPTGGFGGD